MIQSGVYIIRSILHPEKLYVGSTINLKGRETRHFWELNKGIHANAKLQHYFDKYGEDSLQFEVICICKECDLLKLENELIKTHQPFFNICKEAGSRLGTKQSALTKRRISEASKKIHRLSFKSSLVKQKV